MKDNFKYSPADLEAAGKALYGAQWQCALAHALGVDSRRVREWAAGERTPRVGVMLDTIDLLSSRQKEIAKIKRRLINRYAVDTGEDEA